MSALRHWPMALSSLAIGLIGGMMSHALSVGQPAVPVQPVPRELTSFNPIVRKVLPAVVSIEVKGKAAPKADSPDFDDPGFGSGVIIDPSGVVLTNNHVVQDATEADVTLADGRKYTTRDIRHDPKSDLAVLLLPAKEPLPFLELADSDAMEVGDRVLAVGAPFGLTGSVSHGIVSAKSRSNLKLNQFEDFIQTDAAVNPGNSGGPLVNMEGKVIGVTSAIKTRNGGFTGVGLAVASNLCRTVSTQLVKEGTVRRGHLGVSLRDIDADLAKKLGVKPNSGVVITKVAEDGPAAKAGLAVGDIITSVGGQAVKDTRAVQMLVATLPIGKPAEAIVIRDNKAFLAKLVIEVQPEPPPEPKPQPQAGVIAFNNFGLAVADLTPELAKKLGYPEKASGALIMVVSRNSLADNAGLRSGQLIVKVDKTPIENAQGFQLAIGKATKEKGALLHILRPSGEVDFAVLKVN